MKIKTLLDTLIERGAVLSEDVRQFRERDDVSESDLLSALIAEKRVSEQEVLRCAGDAFGLEVVDGVDISESASELSRKIPIQYARTLGICPVAMVEGVPYLVSHSCFFDQMVSDMAALLGVSEIRVQLASRAVVADAVNRLYGEGGATDEIIQDLGAEEDVLSDLDAVGDLLDETSDAPVIKLVNHILAQAVKARASDIHVEAFESEVQVRFRLDGVLHTRLNLPRKIHAALVSRIKIMANLNIAEKRLPQDGRIEIRIGDRSVDLRVSTIPSAFGERVVLRLLEKGQRLLTLEEIGLESAHLRAINGLLQVSHGIVLVTGPTGSGKTTTLYAGLNAINTPDKNIMTIEDPIEYRLHGISQMQVNPKIELNFARGLRAMVRQDPDVILIGEIRDLETAEIAIQSSLTGHLVLSTLHTNDAPSAVTRLADMGIEPFLITSAVRAIVAQRLVRTLCPKCRVPYSPTPEQVEKWGVDSSAAHETWYKPGGCPHCLNTGYRGRSGIYEFLFLDDEINSMILKTSDSNSIKRLACSRGMLSLREDGVAKVRRGTTTMSEVLRVTQV